MLGHASSQTAVSISIAGDSGQNRRPGNLVNRSLSMLRPYRNGVVPARHDDLAETCRVLAVLLRPFIPDTAAKIYSQLALPQPPERFAEAAWGGLQAGHTVGEPVPLFPRRDQAKP
jgi:methionyl-tRNA synthetase